MSNAPEPKQLLIGLPEAGKTTFLAALWHVLQQKEMPTALLREKLEGNKRHLNAIMNAWLNFKAVPRTRVGAETIVSMSLRDAATGKATKLHFPDLSGETFEQQWTSRQMTHDYAKLLLDADGAMLFVHAAKVREPRRIDEAYALLPLLRLPLGSTEQPDKDESVPWQAERVPTQVQLVELLQFIAERDTFRPPFRVAVMISAWDRVPEAGIAPALWLQRHLPLLSQFLKANTTIFESTVFGVSAQGGEYDEEKINALAAIPAFLRINLIGTHAAAPYDLTAPVQWLMH